MAVTTGELVRAELEARGEMAFAVLAWFLEPLSQDAVRAACKRLQGKGVVRMRQDASGTYVALVPVVASNVA